MNGDSLPPHLRDSISAAIHQEIAAQSQSVTGTWLDVDGISSMGVAPGKFVYRLVLSNPVHFSVDQAITFQTRNPRESIPAVVIQSDDEGLVVECEKTLPTDAKLLSVSFDPSFILRGLAGFIDGNAAAIGPIGGLVIGRQIPELPELGPGQVLLPSCRGAHPARADAAVES